MGDEFDCENLALRAVGQLFELVDQVLSPCYLSLGPDA
jgi:hypothetical protein